MDFGDAAQWAGTLVIAVVLIRTIRNNGKEQKDRDKKAAKAQTELDKKQAAREAVNEEKLKAIEEDIKSPEYGLAALKVDMSAIQLNCAKVTSGFAERIKSLEKTKRRVR